MRDGMDQERISQLPIGGGEAARLRGRQSVRTTFKLPEQSIRALSLLASQLGIKQKSLFDHLIADMEALTAIAREFDAFPSESRRVAKTYVISKKTLENLEQVSSEYNTPRDALVAVSLNRIFPLIEQEKEKHLQRQELVGDVRQWLVEGTALCTQAESELGADDPAMAELRAMMRPVVKAFANIESMVDKGSEIETFQVD